MNYTDILTIASNEIKALKGHSIPVVDIAKPTTLEYARQLAKVVSKLSPLLGNMIEFSTVDLLNTYDWNGLGTWRRQDPGFPDAIFGSRVPEMPGLLLSTNLGCENNDGISKEIGHDYGHIWD